MILEEESIGTLGGLPKTVAVAAALLLKDIYYKQQQQLGTYVCLLLSIQIPLLRNSEDEIPSG